MRIAHIIIAHKNPEQVLRLATKLLHSNFDIFVHIDAKIEIEIFDGLRKLPNVFFIKNRINCNWGGYSLLEGILSSLKEVLDSNNNYKYINLISGQDYPVYNAEYINDFFNSSPDKIYISYENSPDSNWWKDASKRYEKYHLTDYNFKGKYLIEKILNAIMPKRNFPTATTLYGSNKACWWALTHESAKFVLSKLNDDPKLIRFLRLCWGTDEFVIPTIIMNSSLKKHVVNNNLRYINWSEGKAHPKILDITDYEDIIQSKMLFSRKFDSEIDTSVMDKIDNSHLDIQIMPLKNDA